jgi:hypothetical protein
LQCSGHGSETIDIKAGESLEVSVYTRSTAGATFSLTDADTKTVFIDDVAVKHTGTDDENEIPTSVVLNKELIKGPVKLKVKADSQGSRFSTHNFLLVFSFKGGN